MVVKYNLELDECKHPVLIEESSINYERDKLNEPGRVVKMLNKCFHLNKLAEEHLYMISLDSKCNLLGVFEISHGGVNQTFAGVREIFQRALISGAVHMILAHNHPSFDISPSELDRKTFENIKDAGKIMGIKLLDFIIVGGKNYYSFLEKKE